MTNYWQEDKRSDVIVENKFHERLSDVRNHKQGSNHPDIEQIKEEQRRQRQKHLATMYGVPAFQGVPAAALVGNTPGTAEASPPRDLNQTLNPGQLESNRSAVMSFQEFIRALERETKRAIKFERPYTLAIVGFHHLPAVIEEYGVPAYDAAMQRIADVLTQVVDIDIDSVGAYTHDRLIMLMPELPGPNATMIAETIRGYFDTAPIAYNQYRFIIQASIGMACLPNHGNDWKILLAKADLACDELYKRGGNSFGFASLK